MLIIYQLWFLNILLSLHEIKKDHLLLLLVLLLFLLLFLHLAALLLVKFFYSWNSSTRKIHGITALDGGLSDLGLSSRSLRLAPRTFSRREYGEFTTNTASMEEFVASLPLVRGRRSVSRAPGTDRSLPCRRSSSSPWSVRKDRNGPKSRFGAPLDLRERRRPAPGEGQARWFVR